jgi:glutamate synthase domain-containing protein 3
MIQSHHQYTGSTQAGEILTAFEAALQRFKKVVPV